MVELYVTRLLAGGNPKFRIGSGGASAVLGCSGVECDNLKEAMEVAKRTTASIDVRAATGPKVTVTIEDTGSHSSFT